MHLNPHPFQPKATTTLRVVGPKRPHSLVVFDCHGVRTVEHPVTGVQHSALMVHQGCGDLVRNNPKKLAMRLLGLPEVLPDELRGREYVDVPLMPPDALESDSYTTWSIAGSPLLVDQIDSDKAELVFKHTAIADTREIITLELLPVQWWHLVRALLSLDAWIRYLKHELDLRSREVRQGTESEELFSVVGAFVVEGNVRRRGRGN